MEYKEMFALLARYAFLVILAIFALPVFYYIFTPLTSYPAYFILKLFYPAVNLVNGATTFVLNDRSINLIAACIGGSAYFFLLLLNFSTPMPVKTRLQSILFLVLSFLALNIARIIVFAGLFLSNYQYFDFAHRMVWYLGSTILVVLLWFLSVFAFKIRSIPFYSDMKTISKDIIKR